MSLAWWKAHATIETAFEIYLERYGFAVAMADGGETGLRVLEDSSFDLMIVDIFIPHMRGFRSIRIFHERAPAIPLVAMSGYAFANLDAPAPDCLRMALDLGAARCLRKPFTPAVLLTVINECPAEAWACIHSGLLRQLTGRDSACARYSSEQATPSSVGMR